MPDQKAAEAWAGLNERQRIYLKAIYDADQRAEAVANSGWSSRPASEWRWVLYSIKAPKELVGRRAIQDQVERQGKLDTGAGSSLAALRRRALILVRDTWVETAFGVFPAVEVQLTRAGRATVRQGLGITLPPRVPTGLLSKEYLWEALVWLYEAGEKGFTHHYYRSEQQKLSPEQPRFRPSWNTLLVLRDRRDGSFWEDVQGALRNGSYEYRYRASALGREHYERHWVCYAHLYPDVEAPRPPASEGAHQDLAEHFVRKPKGLLTMPQWRLLVELVRVHRSGSSPLHRSIEDQHRSWQAELPDLSDLPRGLLAWQIKQWVTPSSTAAAALVGYKEGALAQYTDVRPIQHLWTAIGAEDGARPLLVLHVTDAGLQHFDEKLEVYRRHYPDVPVDDEAGRAARLTV
jgi:hypothetical protein